MNGIFWAFYGVYACNLSTDDQPIQFRNQVCTSLSYSYTKWQKWSCSENWPIIFQKLVFWGNLSKIVFTRFYVGFSLDFSEHLPRIFREISFYEFRHKHFPEFLLILEFLQCFDTILVDVRFRFCEAIESREKDGFILPDNQPISFWQKSLFWQLRTAFLLIRIFSLSQKNFSIEVVFYFKKKFVIERSRNFLRQFCHLEKIFPLFSGLRGLPNSSCGKPKNSRI